MRKNLVLLMVGLLVLSLAVAVQAQEATQEAAGGTGTLTVSDQLSTNGTVVVDNVTADMGGWVVIHPDLGGGQPGPVIGIAPVEAGTNGSITVPIDLGGAKPSLLAALHMDDGTVGRFEYVISGGTLDMPVMSEGMAMHAPFRVTALRMFDQALVNNGVVAHAVSDVGGWLVIHADNNGQPGPVLGQSLLIPGTNPNVVVPLAAEGVTPSVWPMLHVDDGTIGTYEFDGESGLDNPIVVNDQVATAPANLTDAPTVVDEAGAPLANESGVVPSLFVSNQPLMGDMQNAQLMIDTVLSAGPAWVDVHADSGGHPGKSLGMAPVPEGESAGTITVPLSATMNSITPPFEITSIVWPMLHTDNGNIGEYEFMVVPGADLPVIVNGMVVSLPVNLTQDGATQEAGMEATQEAGMEMTPEATEAASG
jgi:hypothetical protein